MINYRAPSTKGVPPVPPNFARNFIDGGWRKIERMYGARDDRLLKWIELSGGQALYRVRAARIAGSITISQAMAMLQPSAVTEPQMAEA